MAKKKEDPGAISFEELLRLSACYSKDIPPFVSVDGARYAWDGNHWRRAGKPQGDEVIVD